MGISTYNMWEIDHQKCIGSAFWSSISPSTTMPWISDSLLMNSSMGEAMERVWEHWPWRQMDIDAPTSGPESPTRPRWVKAFGETARIHIKWTSERHCPTLDASPRCFLTWFFAFPLDRCACDHISDAGDVHLACSLITVILKKGMFMDARLAYMTESCCLNMENHDITRMPELYVKKW